MSRNISFNNTTRNFLSEIVPKIVLQANYEKDCRKFLTNKGEETFINWYLGASKIAYLERKGVYNKKYQLETTSVSGSVSTPSFKQPFDEELFEDYFYWYFYINVPADLSVGTKLVVDIEYDLETSFDYETEYVIIYWNNDNESLDKIRRHFRKEYLIAEYHDGYYM